MANYLGSMSRNWADNTSKQRLLSRRDYSHLGFFPESNYTNENASILHRRWASLQLFLRHVFAMGHADPRQLVFATKSGLALSIVSVLILFKEPFTYMSQYSIWAILTVIIVFKFSIGATLIKGFNRPLWTFLASILALGIAQISLWAGQWQEVVIVVSIFMAEHNFTLERNFSAMAYHPSLSRWGSSEDMLKQQAQWPSRLSAIAETILNMRELKTYESASASSLVTFTSLLIEFVARLQNLVTRLKCLVRRLSFLNPGMYLKRKRKSVFGRDCSSASGSSDCLVF